MRELNPSVEFANKTGLAYSAVCKPLCQKLHLPQTAFDILMFLANNPNYTTARDIVEVRHIKANLVSVNVDKLVHHVEPGLTAVDVYSQTTGACGGIDFWGNCWEWTTSTDTDGQYIIKGGSWDSSRDDCRSEKSDVVRIGTQGYSNVGFRVVRTDLI